MSKALLITLLFIAALFAGLKWWPAEYIPVIVFPNQNKEPPVAQLSVQTIPEEAGEASPDIARTSIQTLSETEDAPEPPTVKADAATRQRFMDYATAKIASDGAQIIDKRAFDSDQECRAAINIVVAEYRRRGIAVTEIRDATNVLDVPGGTMTAINNMDGYFYLVCYPRPEEDWAAYIQFKLTDEQLRLRNDAAMAN